MKTNFLLVVVIGWAMLAEAGTNEIPTFTISAEDVIQSSIYVHPVYSPYGTNKFTVKFQYTETGSNRARAFTVAHHNQVVREKVGEFTTPGVLLQFTNTTGRNGYHGISAQDADAIVSALKK